MIKIKAFIVSAAIIIAIFLAGFVLVNIIIRIAVGHRNEVMVPNMIGMDYNVATKKCEGLSLYLEQTGNIHHESYEKGTIISQEPHPDIYTKKFRTIKVVVSEGPEMVRIPFLYNLTLTEARLKLENAGLQLGEVKHRYSDMVEVDKIIYSEPMADDLIARKSSVTVAVSLGPLNDSSKSNKWRQLLEEDK
ncbi:MAG: PASTA domain-containing protein [Candidatus Cloacimonetes bacterium]|nr:PASTA domain-containing protein [Candidatus Cloacimonadota bacterium]